MLPVPSLTGVEPELLYAPSVTPEIFTNRPSIVAPLAVKYEMVAVSGAMGAAVASTMDEAVTESSSGRPL
ncbi:hypothetical protein SDC9_76973 [bioreactor metagenome]|uniref:Uncharacterized protein n=1 Tax=bioreactor metagenome TaxID=1076179 RepID=A0A644YVD0_9ZZZZ